MTTKTNTPHEHNNETKHDNEYENTHVGEGDVGACGDYEYDDVCDNDDAIYDDTEC